MSAARDTYAASIKSAAATKGDAIFAAEAARQVSTADPLTAAATKRDAIFAAEQAKQASTAAARDTLRTNAAADRDSF